MGLFGDITGKVGLKYTADITQAQIALRTLTGEQKKQAQAAVQGVQDQQKAHEQLAKSITLGMGIAAGAVALGIAAFDKYREQTRLAAASSGADMDKLRDASHGLLTNLELMQVAAQGMNGRWKLSSQEMEKVLHAAVALEHRGIPLAESIKVIGEAINKGEIEPLKQLGVVYDETIAKTDRRTAALTGLSKITKDVGENTAVAGQSMLKTSVDFRNAMNDIEVALGSLVTKLTPLVALAAELIALAAGKPGPKAKAAADLVVGRFSRRRQDWAKEDKEFWHGVGVGSDSNFQDYGSLIGASGWGAEFGPENKPAGYVEPGKGAKSASELSAAQGAAKAAAAAEAKRHLNWIQKLTGEIDHYTDKAFVEKYLQSVEGQLFLLQQGRAPGEVGSIGSDAFGDTSGIDALAKGAKRSKGMSFAEKLASGQGGLAKEGPTVLERMFGKPEEINAYATAWGGFQSTLTAGYDALVSGSESAGKAIRKALAGTIHGIGSKMFVRGLEETAEGFTNPVHFGAAALFFAGAAAAGIIANQIAPGTGAVGGGAGKGAGASASGVGLGGSPGSHRPDNRTYIIGDTFGWESPRSQARRFNNAQRIARSSDRDPTGVEFS